MSGFTVLVSLALGFVWLVGQGRFSNLGKVISGSLKLT